MISIQTKLHQTELAAPYDLYQDLLKTIPQEELFLFESLSGPAEKRKFSLLGCHKLVELSFFGNEIEVTGEEKVVQLVTETLLNEKLLTLDPRLRGDDTKSNEDDTNNHADNCHSGERAPARGGGYRNPERFTLDMELFLFLKKLNALFQITNPSDDAPTLGTGFLSTFGYDFAWRVENLPKTIAETVREPDLTLALFQSVISVNNVTQTATQTSNHLECEHSVLPPIASYSKKAKTYDTPKALPYQAKDTITKAEYLEWVETGLEHIRAGDIYQVQLGHEIIIDTETPVSTVYQNLRTNNPSPYMFLCSAADQMLIGASPEVHIRLEGKKFNMRPIAGTIRRGKTPEEDAALQKELQNDPKECAEHLMLIDLCRNDMGRVCEVGSLNVDKKMFIEQYSHVSHLVSNVVADLKDEYDIYDAMRATFPAGTMSGAPKVRAMEIIESMEKSRRGYYAGAVGFIDFKGDAQLALMIRMGTYKNNRYRIRASAGVVIDSVPDKEWMETLGKMSAMYLAITDKELKNENLTD